MDLNDIGLRRWATLQRIGCVGGTRWLPGAVNRFQELFVGQLGFLYNMHMPGNCMTLVRVTLLAHLAAVLGHVFIIEQPGSAAFGHLPFWRRFVEDCCYVTHLKDSQKQEEIQRDRLFLKQMDTGM